MNKNLVINILLSFTGCMAMLVLFDIRASVKKTEKLVVDVAIIETKVEILEGGFKNLRATQASMKADVDQIKFRLEAH